jgi:hypothetical protein
MRLGPTLIVAGVVTGLAATGASAAAWSRARPPGSARLVGSVDTLPTVPAPPAAPTTATARDARPVTTTTTALPGPISARAPAEIITPPGQDVANPYVLVEPDRYWLYSSNAPSASAWTGVIAVANVPVRTSTDLRHWQVTGDAMPTLPTWAQPGATWAPDVRTVAPGRYVLYFTARVRSVHPDTECIGVATSTVPWGPFAPAPAPLVCQLDHHGSIDARAVGLGTGPGASAGSDAPPAVLVWKADDNANPQLGTRGYTSVWSQPLSADGTRLTGTATRILVPYGTAQARIVEAPQFIRDQTGRWWLLASGGWYNQATYHMFWAECATPQGSCFDTGVPWLRSNAQGTGPGEGSLFVDRDGTTYLVYSPHNVSGRRATPRPVAMARVAFGPDGPYFAALLR